MHQGSSEEDVLIQVVPPKRRRMEDFDEEEESRLHPKGTIRWITYECPLCDTTFNNGSGLSKHVERSHKGWRTDSAQRYARR